MAETVYVEPNYLAMAKRRPTPTKQLRSLQQQQERSSRAFGDELHANARDNVMTSPPSALKEARSRARFRSTSPLKEIWFSSSPITLHNWERRSKGIGALQQMNDERNAFAKALWRKSQDEKLKKLLLEVETTWREKPKAEELQHAPPSPFTQTWEAWYKTGGPASPTSLEVIAPVYVTSPPAVPARAVSAATDTMGTWEAWYQVPAEESKIEGTTRGTSLFILLLAIATCLLFYTSATLTPVPSRPMPAQAHACNWHKRLLRQRLSGLTGTRGCSASAAAYLL